MQKQLRYAVTVIICTALIGVLCMLSSVQVIRRVIPIEIYPQKEEVQHFCYASDSHYVRAAKHIVTYNERIMLAKTCYIEYRGYSDTQVAMVCWCVLNRCEEQGITITQALSQYGQFGYKASSPYNERLFNIASDVVRIWVNGTEGRVLPEGYTQFRGDGKVNHFYKTYEDAEAHRNEYNGYLGTKYDT